MVISVRVEEEETQLNTKHVGGRSRAKKSIVKAFDAEQLQKKFQELYLELDKLFANMEFVGGYALDTIDVGIEISAEGGVNLIGTVTVGSSTAIKLCFKKK